MVDPTSRDASTRRLRLVERPRFAPPHWQVLAAMAALKAMDERSPS